MTVGFHRLLTHRSFNARPALRAGLAVAGSMSFQGSVISWVATHRRHHAFTDRPGDPHSPYRYGTGPVGQLRGLVHAHFGWLFGDDPTDVGHFAPDLVAEPVMRRASGLFPALCVASLAVPALAGWAIGDFAWTAGVTALIWAGLALLSMGESWHNTHHSDPSCARHGVDRGQIGLSPDAWPNTGFSQPPCPHPRCRVPDRWPLAIAPGRSSGRYIRTMPIRANVAVTSYAPDFGAVNSAAPYAVGAGTGFTFGRESPPTQPTPHMRKRRAFHGHNLHQHADKLGPTARATRSAAPFPDGPWTPPPSQRDRR
ncbi:hypothetical protein ABH926_007728 [Catenulispora sp. GP43]|uniref:hypothetical protein n=1 Tax=Catenulispora sp. GP43 TaxID=3156263 RepID=UPI003516076A